MNEKLMTNLDWLEVLVEDRDYEKDRLLFELKNMVARIEGAKERGLEAGELIGTRKVVADIVKLMDCREAPETFAIKVCDYCETKLKEWEIECPKQG